MTISLNHIRQDNQIDALDIGSSSIRLLSGSITPRKQIIINGLIQCPSKGIIQGEIVDINILAKQIAFLIQEFQIKYDVIIDQIITGVSGLFILSENLHGFCTVQDEVIDFEARELAINNAIAGFNNTYAEYSIIQLIPQGYQTETLKYVKAPIGLYAQRLDVDVHVIACNYIYKKNLELAIKKINPDLEILSIIYMGNAASSAVLTDSEMERGVIHIDIGGDTVNVNVFEDNKQIMSFGINSGGNYLTSCISRTLSISMQLAEKLKCKHGIASYSLVPRNMKASVIRESSGLNIALPYVESIHIELRILCNIINLALINIFNNIFKKIIQNGTTRIKALEICSGVVLTGETANLSGIDSVLRTFLSDFGKKNNSFLRCAPKVKIGIPIGIEKINNNLSPEAVCNPENAGVIGLLKHAYRDDLIEKTINRKDTRNNDKTGFITAAANWLKKEF